MDQLTQLHGKPTIFSLIFFFFDIIEELFYLSIKSIKCVNLFGKGAFKLCHKNFAMRSMLFISSVVVIRNNLTK